MSDDVLYKFVWPHDNESYNKPIASILDIIESQYIHYQVVNGRSIIHFFIQLFDGIIGKEACNVISSILFGSLIYMTSRMASQGKNSLFGLSITSAILFLLIPGFHNEFLFFSALFNYLWATIATMCFIFMVYHIKEKNMSVYMLGLSMSSFFFGWLHEGITFPITLTLIIYCILNYHKHKIFKSPIFFCTVFYALGTFVCLSSPGTTRLLMAVNDTKNHIWWS